MGNHSKWIGSAAGSIVGVGASWLAGKGLDVGPDVQAALVLVLTAAGSAVATYAFPANAG